MIKPSRTGYTLWAVLCIFTSTIVAHAPRPESAHFGSFLRSPPDSTSDWPWAEITFSGQGWMTLESRSSVCDFYLGRGYFENVGDTLILRNIEGTTYKGCEPGDLDDLITKEVRYLTRAHKKHSFEILSLVAGHKRPAKWIKLVRPQPKRQIVK
jgi:hypothetical protein